MALVAVPVTLLQAPAVVLSAAYAGPYGHAVTAPAVAHQGDYQTGYLGKGVGEIDCITLVNLPPESPLRSRVRLLRESDGRPVREAWSNGATGGCVFTGLDELATYTVLAYHPGRAYRAEAADNLTPTVPPKKPGLLK